MNKFEDSHVDGFRILPEDNDVRAPATQEAPPAGQGARYHFVRNGELSVAIIDDDIGECEQLSLLFRLEGYRTSFFRSFTEAEAAFEKNKPNVVVAAIELCGTEPAICVRELRNAARGVRIFFTARGGQVDLVAEAMRAGASGALGKPLDKEKLLRLVSRELRRTAQVVPADGTGAEVEIYGFDQLTEREREVLELLVEGRSNKETGKHLGISFRTVEVHRASAMRKLNARNTADLVRIVLSST